MTPLSPSPALPTVARTRSDGGTSPLSPSIALRTSSPPTVSVNSHPMPLVLIATVISDPPTVTLCVDPESTNLRCSKMTLLSASICRSPETDCGVWWVEQGVWMGEVGEVGEVGRGCGQVRCGR